MTTIDDVVRTASSAIFGRPLVTNVYRSVLVEAMLAGALPEWEWCSADYAAYDFRHTADGTRLEVKQSAARQTWFVGRPSRASWDIAPRKWIWADSAWEVKPGRNADIYVFGHHPIADETADHRDPSQWRFFVVAAHALPDTKTISLSVAARLASAVAIEDIPSTVDAVRSQLSHTPVPTTAE